MNDKRFKLLLTVASLTCLLIAAIWKYPAIAKANANKDIKLGEYLYSDPRSIIHVSRKCPKLNYKGWKSKRFKIDDMYLYYKYTPIGEITVCPHCVDDKDYETIVGNFASQMGNEVKELIESRQGNDD